MPSSTCFRFSTSRVRSAHVMPPWGSWSRVWLPRGRVSVASQRLTEARDGRGMAPARAVRATALCTARDQGRFVGGGDRNRTGVQGFAGPCLNHSATPPPAPSLPARAGCVTPAQSGSGPLPVALLGQGPVRRFGRVGVQVSQLIRPPAMPWCDPRSRRRETTPSTCRPGFGWTSARPRSNGRRRSSTSRRSVPGAPGCAG